MNYISGKRPAKKPDASDIEAAIACLRRESRQYVLRGVGSLLGWTLGIGILVCSLYGSVPGQGPSSLLLALCLLCFLAGALMLPHSRSRALAILAESQPVQAVGALLEARENAMATKAEAIQSLLIVLMPRLTTTEASRLNRSQRRILYDTLALEDADREQDYLLAVLGVIELIGDEEALQQVRRLVARGATTAGQRGVLEAATACLPCMEVRLEHLQRGAQLLRASSGAENASELLQPSQPTRNVEPETLLRPLE